MRVLISADIEGIAGVNGKGFLDKDSQDYKDACLLMTDEVNVIIKSCFDNGCASVLVVDSHSSGDNLLREKLDPRAMVVDGKGQLAMMNGVDLVDYCVFVGYHGKANVLNSYCSHTNSTKFISKLTLNEMEVGEGQTNALIAKYFGVKLLMLVGTDIAVKEMVGFIKDVPCVITKNSISQYDCELRNLDVVYAEIDKKLGEAFANKDNISLIMGNVEKVEFRVSVPYSFLLVGVKSENYSLIGRRTIKIKPQNMVESYIDYRKVFKKLSKNYSFYFS
jgi:D-aminopeptidase